MSDAEKEKEEQNKKNIEDAKKFGKEYGRREEERLAEYWKALEECHKRGIRYRSSFYDEGDW